MWSGGDEERERKRYKVEMQEKEINGKRGQAISKTVKREIEEQRKFLVQICNFSEYDTPRKL